MISIKIIDKNECVSESKSKIGGAGLTGKRTQKIGDLELQTEHKLGPFYFLKLGFGGGKNPPGGPGLLNARFPRV